MCYRDIWINHNSPIPLDENGRTYEIHHLDGNRTNNTISNLICVSITDHYDIHYKQGDFLACAIMSKRMSLSPEETKIIHKMAMASRDQYGDKNPMFGRSAIREHNMKWYNNGVIDKMFTEGTQPDDYKAGRLYYPQYDKSGSNNPKAAPVVLLDNGIEKHYECLKDVVNDYPHIPYNTLKGIIRRGHSKKYKITIKRVLNDKV